MQLEQGAGWTRGLRNLLRSELGDWFATRTWWVQIVVWALIVNGMLLIGLLTAASEGQDVAATGVELFSIALGIGGPIGVTIIMMGAVIDEKRSGTAAWVLSKPASRQAFIVAKLVANALGVAVTLVAVQGLLAYAIIRFVGQVSLAPLGFLAAMGVHLVNLLFFLTLAMMLGTLFEQRGPVMAIPIAFLFVQQYLPGLVPFTASLIPWTLVVPGNGSPSLAGALMLGQPLPSLVPLAAVAVASLIFAAVSLWAFSRQEL